jgi:DNA-binding MarR family transcriptional regulator
VQSKVLIMLAENEGASQKQLSDITEIAPVRLGRILNRMEAAGWMERRRHPADGRVRLLAVTENAEPVLRLIQTIIHKTYVEALQGLSTDEIAFMVEALECVHSNLSACEPVGADL